MTKAEPKSTVVVLGASINEERYSFKAVRMLKEHGYIPIPVHPVGHTIDYVPGLKSIDEIDTKIDTLSIYVNAGISSGLFDSILKLAPRRVVFNPGTENTELAGKLSDHDIEVVEACTLVLLRTEQF